MWKNLKNKMRIFLWNHSPRNKAMIPKGSIDTSELTNQTEHFLEKLKEYLDADPQAFRVMQLGSYYNKNGSPDFNEAIPAYLFVSRLSSLYAFQYYIMYSFLIPILAEKDIQTLKIVSFGCGSMIDALSLSFASRDSGKSFDVHYTGVDIAKWAPIYSHPYESDFVQKPLQEYWDGRDVFDGNVIFFPTVLSEILEIPDAIGQFCEGLEKTQIVSDTIFLMVSYRSTASVAKDWKMTDWQKVQKIISTLEKKGFSGEHIPVSPSDDWKTYLQNKPLKTDDGKTYPCYYISPPCASKSFAEIAPDFAPSESVREYLYDPGFIRTICPYYTEKRDLYLAKNKTITPGSEKPDTVCKQTCPIICHPYPKVILSPKTSPCFQIFVFHRLAP